MWSLSSFIVWEDFWANLLAGFILLILGVVLITSVLEGRQRARDKRERKQETLDAERARKIRVLQEIKSELEWNQGQTADLRSSKNKEVTAVLYTTSGWDLICQESVLTTLDPETIGTLFATYKTLGVVNEVHKLAAEHSWGPTVTIVEFAARLQGALPEQRAAFKQKQDEYFDNVIEYVTELGTEDLLQDSVRQIDLELGST